MEPPAAPVALTPLAASSSCRLADRVGPAADPLALTLGEEEDEEEEEEEEEEEDDEEDDAKEAFYEARNGNESDELEQAFQSALTLANDVQVNVSEVEEQQPLGLHQDEEEVRQREPVQPGSSAITEPSDQCE